MTRVGGVGDLVTGFLRFATSVVAGGAPGCCHPCCQSIDRYPRIENLQADGFAFGLWPVRLRWAVQKALCLVLAQVPLVLVLQPVLEGEGEVDKLRIG